MTVDDQTCSECGASNWRELLETQYPERRERDRDKTTKTVFRCRDCGAQGRRFDDGQSGSVTYSGALRVA